MVDCNGVGPSPVNRMMQSNVVAVIRVQENVLVLQLFAVLVAVSEPVWTYLYKSDTESDSTITRRWKLESNPFYHRDKSDVHLTCRLRKINHMSLLTINYFIQWNLDLANSKSLGNGQICSLNRGFVISKTLI